MQFATRILAVLTVVSFPWVAYAQVNTDFYAALNRPMAKSGIGFRAGSNYSMPFIAASEVTRPLPLPYIVGLVPRFGYYLSGYIYKDMPSKSLIFRLDATLQMKEIGATDLRTGQILVKAKYYYLGITPLVGLHLSRHLTVLTGLEANLQLARHDPYPSTSGQPLEIGTTVRATYSFGRFGLEAGYFRGFTPIDKSDAFQPPGSSATNNFYNQNLQLGFLFQLDR